MILAAIDIGSNAARLLISEVEMDASSKTVFRKLNLVRVPLRLGFDVFEHKTISAEKREMFLHTMKSFSALMQAYKVVHYKAFATSAMRDAANAEEIVNAIFTDSGIRIEIISGDTEANLVYENHIAENLDKDHSYLYVDVGGGSTEVSFYSKGKSVYQKSFDIGTIRLLQDTVTEAMWDELKQALKLIAKSHDKVIAIGSGGNINKIFSLSKRKDGRSLPIVLLKDYYREFSSVTVQQRIINYDMRSDRADVIVPALQIYLNIMRWAGAEEIFVPKIGLADGLIKQMWQDIERTKTKN